MNAGTLLTALSEADVIDDDGILQTKLGGRDLQVTVSDFGTYVKLQLHKYEICFVMH